MRKASMVANTMVERPERKAAAIGCMTELQPESNTGYIPALRVQPIIIAEIRAAVTDVRTIRTIRFPVFTGSLKRVIPAVIRAALAKLTNPTVMKRSAPGGNSPVSFEVTVYRTHRPNQIGR